MKGSKLRMLMRAPAAVIVAVGAAALWSRAKGPRADPDLPTATTKQGDFAVLVQCRGSLTAARKVELTAPLDVPDLQIIWLAPSGGPVKVGDVVIRFDASKLQQDLREKAQALKQAQASLTQAETQEQIDAGKDRLDWPTRDRLGRRVRFGNNPTKPWTTVVGVDRSLASRRFSADLVGWFAGLAVLLASIGIYGLLAYMVGQRSREIGIRTALGARRDDILRMFLRKGSRLPAWASLPDWSFLHSLLP